MSEAWDMEIKAIKNKRNTYREKLEKRKKERHDILSSTATLLSSPNSGTSTKNDPTEDSQAPNKSETESDTEIEKTILQMLSSSSLVLPIISTQLIEKLERNLDKSAPKELVNYILNKLSNQGAISIKSVTIGKEVGCEVISVQRTAVLNLYKEFVSESYGVKDEFKRKYENDEDDDDSNSRKAIKIDNDRKMNKDSSSNDASDDIMSLLSMPSTREKQSKQVGEEILELLTKPTAKERSLAEKFKSHGGAQVMEFCPYGTKVECLKAQQATAEMAAKKRREIEQNAVSDKAEDSNAETNSSGTPDESSTTNSEECKKEEPAADLLVAPIIEEIITENSDKCTKLHFKKIIQSHTDESLGDCSFLNTCFHMATCKYVHYEVDAHPNINNNKHEDVKTNLCIKRNTDPSVTLYPPQWIQCDLRYLDMTVLGKFAVVMADPPWDIHMELPYGTMSDDEMRQLGVPALQDDGLIFLWVTGRAMELGRECLKLWGYERVDELIWVKTNQLQRIIRTGRTGHWLNHGKEHCLVGMKGNPTNLNRGLDCDVIVAEVRATSHKPDEIYGIIERLSPGTRKIELFGRPHNVQPNWITLGNQLDGIRLVDPELITQFQKRYPDGNCMAPAQGAKK
ncbi:N6-adenosine-methyltransferase MT-A70-like protein [Episyrphus balteatus]|uniref:N6-adenosine-methyltransferase MT-A70-like protein n=1 Tax=Episyrphus balteatus TaxID=286459 RepID=UPI002486B9FA|nr:N6-adenosine-methyltransferase MT-A70-like protein [Episyrphus balteatus]